MNRRDLFVSTARAALVAALARFLGGRRRSARKRRQPARGAPAARPDRTILPIPEPKPPTIDVLDARNVVPPGRLEVKAANAPNVLIVLLDDMGFGNRAPSAARSTCATAERRPTKGCAYNQFHTTALCSPTRTAC